MFEMMTKCLFWFTFYKKRERERAGEKLTKFF